MSARPRLVHLPIHLDLQGSCHRGNTDLAVEPREQVAGNGGGLGGCGLDNAGLGHELLVTQEYTHHRGQHAVNEFFKIAGFGLKRR
ncbi:MAG: hypothetical protein QOF41_2230 [Methylobacteriaceae bacterium]|nr:hypothetical protein [Methylobacteriaceae bacterium]